MTVAETLVLVRDVAFVALLPLAALLGFILYRQVKSLMKAVKRLRTGVEGMASTVSSEFVRPAAATSAGFGGARAARGVFGLIRKRRQSGSGSV